ncbi:MAG TPA: hypothetical protein VKU40_00820, partial [Thermoanaerobaculia bacterium]|nr:hypothetical protein [Thermoanaerobaculia bacterium]
AAAGRQLAFEGVADRRGEHLVGDRFGVGGGFGGGGVVAFPARRCSPVAAASERQSEQRAERRGQGAPTRNG